MTSPTRNGPAPKDHTVERLSLEASLRSAASNSVVGAIVSPLAFAAVLFTGGAPRSYTIGLPVALSLVTAVLGMIAWRAANGPSMEVLQRRLPAIYLLLAGHGLLTGAMTMVPLEPAGLDNPMYAVLLAMATTIVAANLPTGFARTSMFVVTCAPIVMTAAFSVALRADRIGIALAIGIVVVGVMVGFNARQAGTAFRSAFELQVRNEALVRELEASNSQLEYQAHTDALTDIPNRAGFGHELENRSSGPDQLAVLFVDLNDFKSVNDRFGHIGGDHVLTVVANRMQRALRHGDTVARFGGDEFVVVGNVQDEADVHLLARKIHEAIGRPIVVDDEPVAISASIGTAIMTDIEDVEAIIARADSAMYEAKRDTTTSRGFRR